MLWRNLKRQPKHHQWSGETALHCVVSGYGSTLALTCLNLQMLLKKRKKFSQLFSFCIRSICLVCFNILLQMSNA